MDTPGTAWGVTRSEDPVVRLRHSHNPRPRVRFQTGVVPVPVRRMDGVTIPDPAMVTLLEQAREQGFRMEAGTGGGHAAHTGFTLYPPDKAHPPIRVGCTEVNPSHVANVRRSLVRVGFVPPDTDEAPAAPDVIDLTDGATAMPARRTGRKAVKNAPAGSPLPSGKSVEEALEGIPEEDRSTFVAHLAMSGVRATGLHEDFAGLAGMLVATVFDYAGIMGDDRPSSLGDRTLLQEAKDALEEWERVAGDYQRERDEACAQVESLERQVKRLEEKYDGCVADLKAARTERDSAQEEAARLKRTLAPLKALLAEA